MFFKVFVLELHLVFIKLYLPVLDSVRQTVEQQTQTHVSHLLKLSHPMTPTNLGEQGSTYLFWELSDQWMHLTNCCLTNIVACYGWVLSTVSQVQTKMTLIVTLRLLCSLARIMQRWHRTFQHDTDWLSPVQELSIAMCTGHYNLCIELNFI